MDTSNFKEVFESPKVKELTAQVAEREAEIVRLRECLNNWIGIASNCTIESGCCCCGESMDGHSHPMACGHSPQDMAYGAVNSAIEKTNKVMSTPFTPTTLPELIEKMEKMTIERCARECERFEYPASRGAEAIRALPTGQIKLEDLL